VCFAPNNIDADASVVERRESKGGHSGPEAGIAGGGHPGEVYRMVSLGDHALETSGNTLMKFEGQARDGLQKRFTPVSIFREERCAARQRRLELDRAHEGGAEGEAVEQFWKECHGGNIRVVRAMHGYEH
jgi:hypothetical protein